MIGGAVQSVEILAGDASASLRFWNNAVRSGECWEWNRHTAADGYGRFCATVNGSTFVVLAHRLAYRLGVGQIPLGMSVLHRCDNRRCVNPDHLFIGTNGDNCRDRAAKGRSAIGERNGRAKLTGEQVIEMRNRRAQRETIDALAAAFGIAHSTCWAIVQRRKWTRV